MDFSLFLLRSQYLEMLFEIFLLDDLNSGVHDFFEILLDSLLFVFQFHRQQNPLDLFFLIDPGQIFINIPGRLLVRGVPKHPVFRNVLYRML